MWRRNTNKNEGTIRINAQFLWNELFPFFSKQNFTMEKETRQEGAG